MKITIEFKGGFRDRTTLVGDTKIPRSAAAYPFLTDNGTVGKRVSEMPTDNWKEIFRLMASPEKAAATKNGAKEIAAKDKANPMSYFEMDAAFKKLMADMESKYPRAPDLYSRLSKFKKVIYEIVSREILDDCIYVRAEYIGEDSEIMFPDWPNAE